MFLRYLQYPVERYFLVGYNGLTTPQSGHVLITLYLYYYILICGQFLRE